MSQEIGLCHVIVSILYNLTDTTSQICQRCHVFEAIYVGMANKDQSENQTGKKRQLCRNSTFLSGPKSGLHQTVI